MPLLPQQLNDAMDIEQSIPILEDENDFQPQVDKNTTNRFVVFLDIMGFKDRVARTSHNKLLAQLTDFNKSIIGCIGKYQNADIQLAQFSDSIVLFSNDTTQKNLRIIAEVASDLMRVAIKQQIPIKGAIAQGRITCDIPKQLFFGQALIDAYLLEENIHYYGILIHHTAEASILKLEEDIVFKDIKAPLKSGKISHYELSWYLKDSDKSKKEQLKEIEDALNNIRQTVSDAPRKYIDNTLEVIENYYKDKGNEIVPVFPFSTEEEEKPIDSQ